MLLADSDVQGKTADAARQVERDARAVEAAGAFSVVLESMPRELAARITEKLRIPTIGIGAGPDCDGQILVFHDLVGLTLGHKPKFVREYANLAAEVSRAVGRVLRGCSQWELPVGRRVLSFAGGIARIDACAATILNPVQQSVSS